MNKLILIIFGILLFSSISALTYNLTAGESQSFDLGEEFSYYSIVGNTTSINLSVSQIGTIVTIIPDKYSLNDNFEIIFFNQEKEIINHYSSSGGGSGSGGGRIITVVKNQTVEVPTYIDREIPIETIKEVPTQEPIESEPNYISYIIGGAVVLTILIIRRVYSIFRNRVERRLRK
jgi:hypothetical protein